MLTKFRSVFCLFLIFLSFNQLISYSQDIPDIIKSVMEDTRNKKTIKKYNELNQLLNEKALQVVIYIKPYLTDSSSEVKELAVNILGRIGPRINDKKVRTDIVLYLSQACNDKNSGIRNEALRKLVYFKKEDFSEKSSNNIRSAVISRKNITKNLILLAGFINIPGIDTILNNLYKEPLFKSHEIRWSIKLALARTGNHEAIDYCINIAKMNGINDGVVYEILPGLVYTRTRAAVDYLITIINSDEKSCTSSNADNPSKILCGYRIMEYLVPIIKEFPLKTKASGDIDTNDYEKALQSVREWFRLHKENYIIDDTSL
jgi:hypothetical protein